MPTTHKPTARELIARNRASARTFDWTPDDFGASDFDGYLVESVRLFQRDRFLPQSGEVDRRTVEALHAYRQGIRDGLPNQQRDRNLHELGSVSRLKPDDPRVTRSQPFTGRTLFVIHPSQVEDALQADREVLDTWDTVAAFAGILQGLPPLDSDLRELRRLCLYPVDLGSPFKSGHEARARVQDCEPDGLIVQVNRHQNHLIEQHYGEPMDDFAHTLGDPGCPVAIMADMSWPQRPKATKDGCRAWNVCEGFDAALPVFPGAMVGLATEYAIGQIVTWWSMFGKIRPSFQFPVFDTSGGEGDLTPNHVHRFRAWLEYRGLRGSGWCGFLKGDLWEAFTQALPSDVPRVNY